MHRNTRVVLAGAMLLVPGLAYGADLGLPPLQPPPIVEDFGGWYLRGDIGFSSQSVDRVVFTGPNGVTPQQQNLSSGFDTGGIYRAGIGYKFNSWLRGDLTGEYRTGARFHGLNLVTGTVRENDFGTKSEALFLANAYLDLGTWWCMTPFVGVGIGTAYNHIGNFIDISAIGNPANVPNNYANGNGEWNFAWAVHAGVAYRVTPNFTVELAYRYLDLGDAKTGALTGWDGSYQGYNTFDHITSHDVTLGMRWQFGCTDCGPPPPPVIRKY